MRFTAFRDVRGSGLAVLEPGTAPIAASAGGTSPHLPLHPARVQGRGHGELEPRDGGLTCRRATLEAVSQARFP
jgi:hypothetical protein